MPNSLQQNLTKKGTRIVTAMVEEALGSSFIDKPRPMLPVTTGPFPGLTDDPSALLKPQEDASEA